MAEIINPTPLEVTDRILAEFFKSHNLLFAWNSIGPIAQVAITDRIKDIIIEALKNK